MANSTLLIFVILLVIFAGSCLCHECEDKIIPEGVCAILYEKENCGKGHLGITKQPLDLLEGEGDLPSSHTDDTESVKVRRNCTFRGYDKDLLGAGLVSLAGIRKLEEILLGKGDFVVVNAPENEEKWMNFEGNVRKAISSTSCRCGNKGNCPVVPPFLCAIAYEKPGCDSGEWKNPLEIEITDKMNLNIITSFNYRNNIESVSVRRGCVFRGYKEVDLGTKQGNMTITAPSTNDVHYDLKDPKDLPNAIESFSCTCTA